uniref:Alpha-1,3-mannosyl-glycoprotein 4-beta-N-acetylglucosaminyltransferase A n=1 Tax=Corvus moneduloides TaxID=1196302 RepID=A0A8U7M2E0_CORMO
MSTQAVTQLGLSWGSPETLNPQKRLQKREHAVETASQEHHPRGRLPPQPLREALRDSAIYSRGRRERQAAQPMTGAIRGGAHWLRRHRRVGGAGLRALHGARGGGRSPGPGAPLTRGAGGEGEREPRRSPHSPRAPRVRRAGAPRTEKLIAYQREFHALKERLRIAEHRTLQRSSELNAILEQFRRAVAETNGSKNAMNNFSDETLKLLKELTSRKSLQVPNIYYHLPHLLKNEGSLQPSVQVGLGRTGVSIVMGIPTVKRKVKSYLTETLHSLIDKLSPEEKLDCVMVVFIGETDLDYVNSVVASLEREFSTEINSGLVEVIAPPASYYPDLTNLKETFGDSKERVRWRTKQNLDYCFLMMYAQKKGVYYIQLEDDIVVKQNYFSTIKNFALQLASEDWMILEFSQLGFIGKMFQSPDITLIVEFIFMFYKEKPIDWLLDHILWVKVCNPEKDADKDFLKPLLHKIHVNPPAEVSTSLKVYQGHTLEKTYVGEDFFWAVTPVAGDYILFKFDKPVNVERLVNTCCWSHMKLLVPRMLEDRIWGCCHNLK